ncbi:uncharacterized protein L3040_004705 [Drepanopeziza brunnea f. sp. 'multigermtubi']|uniref:uncharacterized protein n=1 Tax=Drepanopeziza brunnea f. sp. 'multigermtubi' TaxID=698441 RepID=UPI0023A6C62A|nr:hypothetical protein L3040_004705 [Drepanopeziza brunnea f. sp. 'multigermtubi']
MATDYLKFTLYIFYARKTASTAADRNVISPEQTCRRSLVKYYEPTRPFPLCPATSHPGILPRLSSHLQTTNELVRALHGKIKTKQFSDEDHRTLAVGSDILCRGCLWGSVQDRVHDLTPKWEPSTQPNKPTKAMRDSHTLQLATHITFPLVPRSSPSYRSSISSLINLDR